MTGYNTALIPEDVFDKSEIHLPGSFVNSIISPEGVAARATDQTQPPLGCFDWDPFVSLHGHYMAMRGQNVPAMLEARLNVINAGEAPAETVELSLALGGG